MNKKIILAVLACFLSIVACKSGSGNSTPTAVLQNSTAIVQTAEQMTREYLIMQTVIAGEQVIKTPTPVATSIPPAQWTELFTKSPTVPTGTATPTQKFTLTPGANLIPTSTPVYTAPPPKPTKPAPTPIPPTAIPPTSIPPTPAPTEPSP